MKNTFLALSLTAILLSSCKLGGESTSKTPAVTQIKSDAALKTSAVLWQQTSAEYEALCYQAYNIAIDRLRNPQPYTTSDGDVFEASMNDGARNAIIMDLDETVLDNSAYHGYLLLENKEYSKESWNNWVNRGEATLIPGAFEFIQVATELNVPIYYVSNRDFSTTNATLRNMLDLNINVTEDKLLLNEENPASKRSRFERVNRENNVILYIGDNLADLTELVDHTQDIQGRKVILNEIKERIGRRLIILPNPIYGDWEAALNKNNASQIQNAEKNNLRYIKRFH